MDEVTEHFLCREVVQQAQHPLEQDTLFTPPRLLGHNDPGVRTLCRCGGGVGDRQLTVRSGKNDYEYLIFEDMKAAGFEPGHDRRHRGVHGSA
jgi:hypothetical protein